jgi:AraC family transcriptional regulator, dual regulator of chb operon
LFKMKFLKPKFRFPFHLEVPEEDAFGFHKGQLPWDDPNVFEHIHTHKGFGEIMWIESGHGTHFINGQEQPLGPGDILIIRPADVHTFQAAKGEYLDFVNISVPDRTLNYLKKRYFSKGSAVFDPKAALPYHGRTTGEQRKKLGSALYALTIGGRTGLDIEAFLINLFRDLLNPVEEKKLVIRPQWLENACSLIKRPENLVAGVPRFIRLAGRSREYVARETKKWLGVTPTELVNQARLAVVAARLADKSASDSKVYDLALESGFKSLSNFYVLFEKHYQVTPHQYRQKMLLSLNNSLTRRRQESIS